MRHCITRFVAVALAGSLIACLGVQIYAWKSTPGEFVIPQVVDIGTVDENVRIEVSVPLTNGSDQPVRVYGFKSTCGCMGVYVASTSGELELASSHLVPPKSILEVSVRLVPTAGEDRLFVQQISFAVEGPPFSEATILLSGKVNLGVATYPSGLAFGEMKPGETAERDLFVVDARHAGQRTPLTMSSSDPAATVASFDPVPRPDHLADLPESLNYYRCLVLYKAADDAGPITGEVKINGPGDVVLRRSQITGCVNPDIYLVPCPLVLTGASKEPWTGRAMLRSRSGAATVEVLSSSHGLRSTVQAGILEVRFDPASTASDGKGTVVVVATLPNGQSHRLTLPVHISSR